jgi:hypothetical protein
VPNALLDFKPHKKTNPIRTILAHQLLSERRFFAQFVGTEEPLVEQLLPPGENPLVQAYIAKYVWLARRRLPQLAHGTAAWWLEQRPFFGRLERERIWVFWRRVLHARHHRTQVQPWLGLAGHEPVPAIYGPSGDVEWDEADPTVLGGGDEVRGIIASVPDSSKKLLTPADTCIYNNRDGQGAARSWTKPRPAASTPSPRRASPCACGC